MCLLIFTHFHKKRKCIPDEQKRMFDHPNWWSLTKSCVQNSRPHLEDSKSEKKTNQTQPRQLQNKRKTTQVTNIQVAANDTSHTGYSLHRGSTRGKVKSCVKSKGSMPSRWELFTDLTVSFVEILHFKPERRRNWANRCPLTYISALADNNKTCCRVPMLPKAGAVHRNRHLRREMSTADCMCV